MLSSSVDRRRHPRFAIDVPAKVLVSSRPQPITAEITDLSQGGCFFATDQKFQLGRSVSVNFVLSRAICGATGSIVRVNAGQGVGVAFSDANQWLQAFVRVLQKAPPEQTRALAAGVTDVEIHVT